MEGITRLFRAMFAPGEAFEAAKLAPKMLLPILLVTLLMTGVTGYYAWNVDRVAIVEKSLDQSSRASQIPEAQREQIVTMQSKVMKYSMPGATFFFTPIMLLLMGLYFYLAAKISGSESTYAQATTIAVYSSGPTIIWAVVAFAIMFMGDFSTTLFQDLVPSNLAYFMDAESLGMKLFAAMRAVDFFSIWRLILMIIGFSVISGSKMVKSALIVLIPWALLTGIGLLFVG